MDKKLDKNLEDIVSKRMAKLNRFVNLIELAGKDKFNRSEIKKYYKITKYLLYRVFGSYLGYMHMAISENNQKSDFNYQPRKISELIKETGARNVLELGSGQSANIVYLATIFPEVAFTGIDLYPSVSRRVGTDNISIQEGDYHDLRRVESDSMDIVYAIETLCYSTDKQKVYDEVYRVLKKGGLFVVWDGYLGIPRNLLTPKKLLFINLIENGFCLDAFEYFGDIKSYEKKFRILKSENMKEKLFPFVARSRKKIDKYMRLGIFFKAFCYIMPKKFINNLAPIYFIEDSINYDLTVYYELKYEK